MEPQYVEDFYDEERFPAVGPDSANRGLVTSIPQRVKSGSIDETTLRLETANETLEIPAADVELLCLGIIKYEKDTGEAKHSKIRQAIRKNLFGEEETEQQPEFNITNLLDIYIRGHVAPYRIDAASINYKSFLKTVGYISAINFRRLIKLIAYYSTAAQLEPAIVAFIKNQKDRIITYQSVYVFQDACTKFRKGSTKLVPRSSVEISPEGMVDDTEEWNDWSYQE